MDALDALTGPWREHGLLLVPAAYRAPASRPAELSYLRTRITYAELFGTEPTWNQFFERLGAIGLHSVMASLSYLNSVLHVKGTLNAQTDLVNGTFDRDLRRRIVRLPEWRDRVVYSPAQVLMVMKAAILHSPDHEDERPDGAYGRQLAEVLLMANDLLDPGTSAAAQAAQDRPQLIAALLAHSIRSTLANAHESYEPALARASMLFGELSRRDDVRARAGNVFIDNLEAQFTRLTGLTFRDYFAVGLAIVGWFRTGAEHPDQVTQRKLSPATYFSLTRLDPAIGVGLLDRLTLTYAPARQAFVERETGTRLFGYDVLPFMGRPLYRVRDDVTVPASLAFLESAVTKGVYWLLFDAMPTNREKLRFSAFYGHVMEAYVRDAMQRALPDGPGLARRVFGDFTYMTGLGERRTSDVVVLYGAQAVFMEVTTSRLRMEETMLVDDPEAVAKDFEKVVIRKAHQLHAQVEHFRQRRFNFDGMTADHVRTILPVVVTGDPIPMWTTTMETIVDRLQRNGLLQGAGICPLRVIGVDEVEMLEPLVRAGHSLYDILRAHADDVEYRNVSLRNFLQARFGAVPPNEPIRTELNAIGSHAGYLLFGRDPRQAVEGGIESPDVPRRRSPVGPTNCSDNAGTRMATISTIGCAPRTSCRSESTCAEPSRLDTPEGGANRYAATTKAAGSDEGMDRMDRPATRSIATSNHISKEADCPKASDPDDARHVEGSPAPQRKQYSDRFQRRPRICFCSTTTSHFLRTT